MKRSQKALFWFLFLFFLAFSQLNISLKFELTIFPLSLSKVFSFFVIVFNDWGKTVNRVVFLSVSTIWKLGILKFLFLFYFVVIF